MRFDEEREVTLRVDGSAHVMVLEPRVTLVDALRDRLGLTGTKKGCDRGECGACTVHVAGRRVLACMTLAVAVADTEVITIEGSAPDGSCIRCSGPSSSMTRSSAGTARRAR